MKTNDHSEKPLKRLWGLVRIQRQDILRIFAFVFLEGAISLSLPLGIQAIFNFVSAGKVSTSWAILIILVVLGIALNGVFRILQLIASERIQQRIFAGSAFEFAYRIPRIKFEALDKHYVPELVNRFFDTQTLQKGISKLLIDFSSSILQIFFGLLLLSFYHPLFILFGLILVGVLMVVIYLSGPLGLITSLNESKYKYKIAHWLEEMARSRDVFKQTGPTDYSMKLTDELLVSYLNSRKSHFSILLFKYGIVVGVQVLIIASLLVIGSTLVMQNELSLGQFVAAEVLIILMINSAEKLILSVETIYDVLTALEKIGFFADFPLEESRGHGEVKNDPKNGIAIHLTELSWNIPEAETHGLEKLNLKIEPNEKIAILGWDDMSKNSLLAVISGKFESYTGSLRIDDTPLPNLDLRSYREQTGTFFSDRDVFEGTIWDNITVGKKDISLETVVKMSEITGLNEFVDEQKTGYSTFIPAGGKGFRDELFRKIILTRALANQPRLLLLHHPFIGLPEEVKQNVLNYILDPNLPVTVIMTTRDLNIARQFGKVFLLKEGKLIPYGDKI